MLRKSFLSLLVIFALFLAGCASAGTVEDANGVSGNANDVSVTGIPSSDANANDFNANEANTNDLNTNTANTNDVNANTAGVDTNTNTNDNMNANANDNMNANTNTNTNANGNENANTNDNTNASDAPSTTATPAAPAGTGLANPDTYDLFVQALTAQGLTITPDADFTTYTFGDFPAGRGRALDINGETVYVIEFDDAATAQAVYQSWQSGALQLQDYFQTGVDGSSTNANSNASGGQDTGTNMGDANVWAYGRILVVYFGDDAAAIQTIGQLMNNADVNAGAAELPAGVLAAIDQYAAGQFQATPGSVQILSVMPVDFQDVCLGVPSTSADADANGNGNTNDAASAGGDAAANCAQVITPGWAVTVLINGQQYVLRINQDGSVVRQAPAGMDQ